MNLKKFLIQKEAVVNKALKQYIKEKNTFIAKAMRYSLYAGGKRLRPILVICGAEICGGKQKDVLHAACAIEFIHTYSLIHDDLPAMDNDDLRRGKPTNHKKFGEAAAILAGDALLTEAFYIMTEKGNNKNSIEAIKILAEASGYRGMIGGQMKDTIESNNWQNKDKKTAIKILNYIHLNKTSALIRASLLMGAVLSNATAEQIKALDIYGKNIGLAFQITDDILDIIADKTKLGKKGSDRDNNKLTYPAIYGIEKSKLKAINLVNEAKEKLEIFKDANTQILKDMADFIVNRQY